MVCPPRWTVKVDSTLYCPCLCTSSTGTRQNTTYLNRYHRSGIVCGGGGWHRWYQGRRQLYQVRTCILSTPLVASRVDPLQGHLLMRPE